MATPRFTGVSRSTPRWRPIAVVVVMVLVAGSAGLAGGWVARGSSETPATVEAHSEPETKPRVRGPVGRAWVRMRLERDVERVEAARARAEESLTRAREGGVDPARIEALQRRLQAGASLDEPRAAPDEAVGRSEPAGAEPTGAEEPFLGERAL